MKKKESVKDGRGMGKGPGMGRGPRDGTAPGRGGKVPANCPRRKK